jgi:hypothetical protein
MRRVYICILIAASAAILFSRIRFIRNNFDSSNESRPVPAADSSAYGPDSISESAVDTRAPKLEPERKSPVPKPPASPAPRPPADDF